MVYETRGLLDLPRPINIDESSPDILEQGEWIDPDTIHRYNKHMSQQ